MTVAESQEVSYIGITVNQVGESNVGSDDEPKAKYAVPDGQDGAV
jgi:hypothetical protein